MGASKVLTSSGFAMRHKLSSATSLLACGIALLIGGSACESSSTEPLVDAIVIRQAAETLDVGQSVAFSASLHSAGAEVANAGALRWTSSDPAVLTIDNLSGSGRAKDVRAPTVVTVTATFKALRATLAVVVFPKLTGLKLLTSSSIAVGHVVAPTARVGDPQLGSYDPQLGSYTKATSAWGVRFESTNPAVLRANTDGTVTAIAPGTSRLTVDVHGKRDSTNVTVIAGYAVTLLPATAGVHVVDVNDSGDVVGSSGVQSTLIRGGQQIALGYCDVQGINNRGQVLCSTSVYENGVFTNLFSTGTFKGKASGIDESGAVFGMLMEPDSLIWRAFLWRAGTIDVFATSGEILNSTGRVAAGRTGLGNVAVTFPHGILLQRDGQIPLNGGEKYTHVNAINGAENVVGIAGKYTGVVEEYTGRRIVQQFAMLWLKSKGYIGQYLDERASGASGISDADNVVGIGDDGAFVWRNGEYTVLSDVVMERGWTSTGVPLMSRNGTIAVSATNIDGRKGIILLKLQ